MSDVATGMPPMIGRMLSIPQWLEYVAGYQFGSLAPSRIVLHHTWRPSVAQWRGLASMQGMQKFYAGKGWNSAPHIYVGPDGIWLFTPMRDIGIHAGAGNGSLRQGWYSIGIEMVGDCDRARPDTRVWEGTKAVIGGLCRRLGLNIRQALAFHRDYSSKSCPGWAVTKDWVIGEVEAWLGGAAPPAAPPVGAIGWPPPDVEELGELLLDQAFARRGEGYNSGWAFHTFAVQNDLGYPTARSARLSFGGKEYAFQPFARDTLYCEIPNWGDVQRLSELLAGSLPPANTLGRALLDATYKTGGATFHPEWAFHQYAMAGATLGPPLAESKTVVVDGVTYSYQVYATDTIFNPGQEWSNIQRLSALANTSDPAKVRLRDALLGETYKAAGQTYRPDWAFHQLARTLNLGAPLGATQPVTSGGQQYNFQVYATDTLYNVVPKWNEVRRLGELVRPKGATLGDKSGALLSAEGAKYDPELGQHYVVEYRVPGAGPTAYGTRSGSRISAIVLHGDAGPAAESLARMATPGAEHMTHYYVAADGAIYRLVGDEHAAFHSGMAIWNGRKRNMNRISIGVAVERGRRGFIKVQTDALADLLTSLMGHYKIRSDAVVRWGDLRPDRAGELEGLPMELIVPQED